MHERFGDAGVAQCLGAFAFALWGADTRRVTLGRDCLGNRALFYHRGPQFVAFATSLRSLLALPGVPRALDELALAQFIAVNHREQAAHALPRHRAGSEPHGWSASIAERHAVAQVFELRTSMRLRFTAGTKTMSSAHVSSWTSRSRQRRVTPRASP